MFKRVALESWHEVVPYVCFALIAASFIYIVIRAIRMKQKDIDHVANLPLLDDEEAATHEEPSTKDKS